MNKFQLLVLLTLLLSSCRLIKINKAEGEEYFKVEIVQDGKVVKEKNGVLTLEKRPFVYQLTLYKVTGIDVSNSWGKYYFDYPAEKNIYQCEDDRYFIDCRFVAVKTGNEDKFNENKDIYVGDEDYQFHWFYQEDSDWHRLDKGARVENGVTYAQVTVENIYDLDKRDAGDFSASEYAYPIEKINQDIYVVFAASRYESGMEQPEELQREKFILTFK